MNETQSRVPEGVPTGGQYAATPKADADVALDAAPQATVLTEDEFDTRYETIDAPDGGTVWDTTYFEQVRDTYPPEQVWTVIDGDDGSQVLDPGFHVVNRAGYVVTTEPWEDPDTLAEWVPADGDQECPRHGGEWGDDPTCDHCATADGQPRPVDAPGSLGPGAPMTENVAWDAIAASDRSGYPCRIELPDGRMVDVNHTTGFDTNEYGGLEGRKGTYTLRVDGKVVEEYRYSRAGQPLEDTRWDVAAHVARLAQEDQA